MDNEKIIGAGFFISVLVGVGLVLLLFLRSSAVNETRVVFCDVGQGDGAYIRTKEKIDIVIDAGPGGEMSRCLGAYMPFYDKEIELAFLSHPQKDHYGGFAALMSHYKIKRFVTSAVDNDNKSFNALKKELLKTNTQVINGYRGDSFVMSNNSRITLVWPKKDFFAEHTSAKAVTGATQQVLGAYDTTLDLNEFSEVLFFTEGNFNVLFTGDADSTVLSAIAADPIVLDMVKDNDREDLEKNCNRQVCLSYPNKLEIIKVPHHGSKNGLSLDFLKLADPMLGVISVAKKNGYGHPSKEVLDMFNQLKKQYVATKDAGDVVIDVQSDGTWERE